MGLVVRQLYLRLQAVFAFFALLALAYGSVQAEDAKNRFALIVANAEYSGALGRLETPLKDAALLRDALIAVGFPPDNIKIAANVARGALLAAVERHADRLRVAEGDAVGFLYYSGHGAAKPDTDRNYLIPITVEDIGSPGFWHEAVELEVVRRTLQEQAPDAAHIIVFDACRDELRTRQRGGGKGFAPGSGWGGMLVAYSTGPRATASDGAPGAPGSPYAVALSEQLRAARDISAPDLFGNMRAIVSQRTQGQQPWYLNGLDAPIVFSAAHPALPEIRPKTGDLPLPISTIAAPRVGASGPETPPVEPPLFQGLVTTETDLRSEPRQLARTKIRLSVGSTLFVLAEVENSYWYRVRLVESDVEGFVMKNEVKRLP